MHLAPKTRRIFGEVLGAINAGAPPLPEVATPLEERAPLPVESLWKVQFLISTWDQGARFRV